MNTLIQHLHTQASAAQVLAYLQADNRSYADFYQDVSLEAQCLLTLPETTWALWCEDSYAFAVRFFALLLAGKTVVLPPNRIAATVSQLAEQGIAFYDGKPDAQSFAAIAAVWPNIDWEQAAVVFFTSGSTGTPKKIHRTMGQLMREVDVLQTLFPWPATTTVFATVSHQHLFGLCYKILLPMQQGASFVGEQCQYPEDLARAYSRLQRTASVLISSPAF